MDSKIGPYLVTVVAIIAVVSMLVMSNHSLSLKGGNDNTGFALLSGADCLQKCDYFIDSSRSYMRNQDFSKQGVKPGETICLTPGTRGNLAILHLKGTKSDPITITNCGGDTTIDGSNQNSHTFRIVNSTNFRVTGAGDPSYDRGIKIINANGGSLSISGMSSDYEIDHLEIRGGGQSGLHLKTDASCSMGANYGHFTQHNTIIHDNYIEGTGNDGILLGVPLYYYGYNKNCSGSILRLYPHDLKGVKIYDNLIVNAGWDGINVIGATSDVEIYGNTVINATRRSSASAQDAGINIDPGSVGKVYNNYIEGGKFGIYMKGSGGNLVYNNIIVRPVADAILTINGNVVEQGQGYHFENNLIINPGRYGIYFATVNSTGNTFINNLYVGLKPMIYISTGKDSLITKNNINYGNIDEAKFFDVTSGNYRLTSDSPAVDAGIDTSSYGVVKDYDGVVRPTGKSYDVGPFEYVETIVTPPPIIDEDYDGYTIDDDCNDHNGNIHPAATEVCGNSVDENCDGVDMICVVIDVDNDGYAASADCNDDDPNVNPGKSELCNGIDDNCNDEVDELPTTRYYTDSDSDNYGSASQFVDACMMPPGYAASNNDCNDANYNVNPGRAETCNAMDDDCDTLVDEGTTTRYYIDSDLDTYGSASSFKDACTKPAGYVTSTDDCNDNNANVNPGKPEVCGNSVDENCDGSAPACSGTNATQKIQYFAATPYNYAIYFPPGYDPNSDKEWPLLIYLHGSGARGTSMTTLFKVVSTDGNPLRYLNDSASRQLEMIVIAPQTNSWGWGYYPDTFIKTDNFLNQTIAKYKVDESRIYMTGLSMGGQGSWDYAILAPGRIAAIVPIAAKSDYKAKVCNMKNKVAVWGFHNFNDTAIDSYNQRVGLIPPLDNNCGAPINDSNVKYTEYPKNGHGGWTETYYGTGKGKEDPRYDPFNEDVYTWMLRYSKDCSSGTCMLVKS